jgi:glycerol-3-phosphate O-acyltransferase
VIFLSGTSSFLNILSKTRSRTIKVGVIMATWQAVLAGGFKEIVFVYVY